MLASFMHNDGNPTRGSSQRYTIARPRTRWPKVARAAEKMQWSALHFSEIWYRTIRPQPITIDW